MAQNINLNSCKKPMDSENLSKSPRDDSEELVRFKLEGEIVRLDPIRLLQRRLSRTLSCSLNGQPSVEDFGRETLLLSRLAWKLVQIFGFGYQWIMMTIRLVCFALLLFPAIVRIVYEYLLSNSILNIRYGKEHRNLLDVFLPSDPVDPGKKRPVLVFVSGGAWIIGYKGWGAHFGRILSNHGIIVVNPDYRNFPQGTISDMVSDVELAVQWVFDNIQDYGGDVEQVYLVGQSAGAHISCMSFLRKRREGIRWNGCDLRGWIGISGAYNLEAHELHFHNRGLYRRIFRRIMENNLKGFSPSRLLRTSERFSDPQVLSTLPVMYLFHGSEDQSIPDSSSFELAYVLSKLRVDVTPVIYSGKSHTDPIIEDPLRGDMNLLSDLMMIVKGTREKMDPTPLYSRTLVAMAKWVNPF